WFFFGQSTLERFIKQSKASASSSLAKRQISTISAAGTTRKGSLFAGASAPMRSPDFAARRCWISSNVIYDVRMWSATVVGCTYDTLWRGHTLLSRELICLSISTHSHHTQALLT